MPGYSAEPATTNQPRSLDSIKASRAPRCRLHSQKASQHMARPTKLNLELQSELAQYLRLGCYVETAAGMCGIDRATFQGWIKRGAREKQRLVEHHEELEKEKEDDKSRHNKLRTEERQRRKDRQKNHRKTGAREKIYAQFHDVIEKAIAQAELGDLATIAQAAKGGHVLKRTVVTDSSGTETVNETRSKPEWQASAWRLERRNPSRWAQVRRLEVSGKEDGAPVALTMADAFKHAYQERKAREKRESGNDVAKE